MFDFDPFKLIEIYFMAQHMVYIGELMRLKNNADSAVVRCSVLYMLIKSR